jgi:hypothetical protein
MQSLARRSALAVALALSSTPLLVRSCPASASEQVTVRQDATASVGGVWCGVGPLHEFTLEIVQHLQNVQGRLTRKARVREITGHVEGARVKTDPLRNETMELLAQGDALRVVDATGLLALARGQSFTRAAGGSCTH